MTRPIYRFGDYALDAVARQPLCAGKPVQVPAKVFDCLLYLIEQQGRAVGHDELVAAVWGKTEVSESLLRQTIRRARRARQYGGADSVGGGGRLRFRQWIARIRRYDRLPAG